MPKKQTITGSQLRRIAEKGRIRASKEIPDVSRRILENLEYFKEDFKRIRITSESVNRAIHLLSEGPQFPWRKVHLHRLRKIADLLAQTMVEMEVGIDTVDLEGELRPSYLDGTIVYAQKTPPVPPPTPTLLERTESVNLEEYLK